MIRLLYLSMTAFLLAIGIPLMAEEITIDLTDKGFQNAEKIETVTQDGVTLTFALGSNKNGNAPTYYTKDGASVRCYIGNTLKISANDFITKITFTFSSESYFFKSDNCSVSTGSIETTGNPSEWKGKADEVVFTNTTPNEIKDKWWIQTITLTIGEEPTPPPSLVEVDGIAALRQLSNGSRARLVLPEENAGSIEWVDTNNGTYAYVRDNDMAVRFANFLPNDAGWHTKAGGTLIGAVEGEYNFNNGMPEFTHIDTSIADSILCLDFWQTSAPIVISDLSVLTGTDYRADYVMVNDVSLSTDDGEHYEIVSDDIHISMTNKFGVSDIIPEDLRGRHFDIQGILGASDDGSTSVLYYTQIDEVMPELALSETLYNNTATIGEYDGRNVNITVNRQLTTNTWNTICLPFDIYDFSDIVSAAKLAEFTGYDAATNTLEFSSVESLQAGRPYLVYPTEEVSSIRIIGASIVNEITPVTYGTYDMVGIFDPTTLNKGDRQVLFLGDKNTLYHPNVTNDLKAFRAYFHTTSESAANISVDGIISDIRTATIESLDGDPRIYNVSGQLVGTSTNGLQKGVYVSNGNKVIIK